jgi:ABC-type glycerol-3-phosphate transport system substrate-binding protein
MRSSWVRRFFVVSVSITAIAGLSVASIGSASPSKARVAAITHAATKLTLNIWDVFYFPKQSGAAGAQGKAEQQIDQAFMKKFPNITVKHVGVPGTDFFTDIREFVASRSGPDIITDGGSSFAANAGWTKAIYPTYKLITPLMKKQLGPYLAGEGIGDTAHYSIPVYAGVYAMYYNKHDFTQAGITAIPKTFPQLLADCTALQKVGITPITNGFTGLAGAVPWDYGTSNQVLDQKGLLNWSDFKIGWTDPRIIASLTYLQQMSAGGCFGNRAAASTETDTDGVSAFEGNRGAMYFGSNLSGSAFGTPAAIANVGVFAFPKEPTSVYPVGTPDTGYNANWSIMNYTKVCAAAWDYVQFYDGVQAQTIQWKVAGIIPANTAVKAKGTNGVDDTLLALAANKYGHHGPGGTTSAPELTLLGQLIPELISGAITPAQLASQLQAERATQPVPPSGGKLPNPPPCVNGKSVAG